MVYTWRGLPCVLTARIHRKMRDGWTIGRNLTSNMSSLPGQQCHQPEGFLRGSRKTPPAWSLDGTTFDGNTVLAWITGDFRRGFERGNEPTPALRERCRAAPPLQGRGFSSTTQFLGDESVGDGVRQMNWQSRPLSGNVLNR